MKQLTSPLLPIERDKGDVLLVAKLYLTTTLRIKLNYDSADMQCTPLYLYKRKQTGHTNRLIPGIIIDIIYIGSWNLMLTAVEMQRAEVLSDMNQIGTKLELWEY